MADGEIEELRTYRDLRRRRDVLIRRAHRDGHPVARIAAASGLTVRRVRELVRC